MTSVKTVVSDIFEFIKGPIKKRLLDHEIENQPNKHIRRVFGDTELQHIAPFDNDCIFYENRLHNNLLMDNMKTISQTSPFFFNKPEPINLPIKKITQILCSNSESAKCKWKSIYDFGKYTYESGPFKNSDNIDSLIKHVNHENSSFSVSHYTWNDQYLLENCGGSHHFAMAFYHIVEKHLDLTLPVQLNTYSFDEIAYGDFCQVTSVFVTHKKNLEPITELKGKYHFIVDHIYYPLHGSPNVIFSIPTGENVARIIASEYGSYFMPFHGFIESL